MVGEEGYREKHERAEDPSGFFESVRKAKHARANYGDEDIGEGLGLGREFARFG